MKSFIAILVGAVLGQVAYVAATYDLYPQELSPDLSYGDNILVALGIGVITAFVFFGFFKLFKVRTQNPIVIGVTALITQITIWVIVAAIGNWGSLGLVIGVLVFSAIANFLVDKLPTSSTK